jgi:hypothetical protein
MVNFERVSIGVILDAVADWVINVHIVPTLE